MQATLESCLLCLHPKEIGQICISRKGLAIISPAGPAENKVKQKYCELHRNDVVPIFLNPDKSMEIYKKGELCARGLVVIPQKILSELLQLVEEREVNFWKPLASEPWRVHLPNYAPEDLKFNDAYAEHMEYLWNNIDWDLEPELPIMLRNTVACAITPFVAQIKPEYAKYIGKIILPPKAACTDL
jgi:hypothetical protein